MSCYLSLVTYHFAMLLAAESHKRIESFLREHLRDPELKLPPIHIYSGRFSRRLTSAFHILAITFGRRIFVAPKILTRNSENRLLIPAELIAHEATHVVQYTQYGFVGFLISYLSEYLRALKKLQQGWSKAARHAAYLEIKQELEARQAEMAYTTWQSLKNSPQS